MAWTRMKTAIVAGGTIVWLAGTGTLVQMTRPSQGSSSPSVSTGMQKPLIACDASPSNAPDRFEPEVFNAAQIEKLRAENWPAEKRATEEKIKSRQAFDETIGASTIDLRPYTNASLNDSPLDWPGADGNNLAEVPSGVHIFGGVSFDVEGVIYLTSGRLQHYHKDFPVRVDGIDINCRCSRIHLFHGASGISIDDTGETIAELILNYSDGSERELNIDAGKEVIDWRAPLFKTGVSPLNLQTASDTEPAWTGSNALLKKEQPEESLVLCRTTFENPRPDVILSSIDYVSMNTKTVPFMLGLTVE